MTEEENRIKKRVDEAWKAQVEQERRSFGEGQSHPGHRPSSAPATDPGDVVGLPIAPAAGPVFEEFLSSLSMQAMVALGEVPHPSTRQPEPNLEQARYLIDVLGLLQEKTKGNLGPEEKKLLEGLLYELRMKYLSKTQG